MRKLLLTGLTFLAVSNPVESNTLQEINGASLWGSKIGETDIEGDTAKHLINDIVGKYQDINIVNNNTMYPSTSSFLMSKSTGYITLNVNEKELYPMIRVGYFDYSITTTTGIVYKGWNEDYTEFNELSIDTIKLLEYTNNINSYEISIYGTTPMYLESKESSWVTLNTIYPMQIQGGKSCGDSAIIKVFDALFDIQYPQAPIQEVFGFLTTLFTEMAGILEIKLFGFLPIGTIIAIPIIFSILEFILKL